MLENVIRFLETPITFSDRCSFTEAAASCNEVKAVDDLVSVSMFSTDTVENSPFRRFVGRICPSYSFISITGLPIQTET